MNRSLFFSTKLYWKGGQECALSSFPRPDILGGPPPEFGGSNERWSPEHLLLGASALCFAATLTALAKRSRVAVTSLQCEADGKVEKTPQGLRLTGLTLRVFLGVAGAAEAGHRLVEAAKSQCLVANSLNVPVEVRALVNGRAAELPAPEPAAA